MANNRLYLCIVDNDDKCIDCLLIAKHLGGPWFVPYKMYEGGFVNELNEFLAKAFIHGSGITLKDEYMESHFPTIHLYNEKRKGKWVFIPKED